MAALRKSEKFLLVLAIVVVFSGIWIFVVLQPILDYGKKLDSELANKNFKLREAKHILALSAQGAAAPEAFRNFQSEGSAQEDLARMIKDIEAAAVGTNLKVLETKPQPQINNVGWFELQVSISFEGNWSDVIRFLYELENTAKPLLVNEMSLESELPQQSAIRGRLVIGRLLTQI